jgi:hypothetical protein
MKFVRSFLLVSLFLIFPTGVAAQIISVKSEGNVVWDVLGDETTKPSDVSNSSIEVKKVVNVSTDSKPTITLSKEGGSVNLTVANGNETRDLTISGDNKNLVEIEERPYVQKVTIGVIGNRFSLTQGTVTALTDFPINVDAKSARFLVKTTTGMEFLFVLPNEAVSTAIKSRLMTDVGGDIEITEGKGGASYKIVGEKVFNFFDLYKYSIPITAYVSASSGQLTSIDSPTWFKFLKFLFI